MDRAGDESCDLVEITRVKFMEAQGARDRPSSIQYLTVHCDIYIGSRALLTKVPVRSFLQIATTSWNSMLQRWLPDFHWRPVRVSLIVFIFSSIFAIFSNLCVFSPTPPHFSPSFPILRGSERVLYSTHMYSLSGHTNVPTNRPTRPRPPPGPANSAAVAAQSAACNPPVSPGPHA